MSTPRLQSLSMIESCARYTSQQRHRGIPDRSCWIPGSMELATSFNPIFVILSS